MKRIAIRSLQAFGVLVCGASVIFAALVLWPQAAAPLPAKHDIVLIDGASIVDVESGTAGSPTRILVREGEIIAIDPNLTAPANAHRIDASGQWVMPGLWDMHSHSWQVSPQLHLPLQLAHGVTSVRDMMGCPEDEDPLVACHEDKRRWSDLAENGTMASPRFVADASFFYEDASLGPGAVRERVRSDKSRGITLLKVYNRLSASAYDALVESGAEHDLAIVGHLPKSVALDHAVSSKQRSFEHGRIFIEGCFADAALWRAGAFDDLARPVVLHRMLERRDAAYCETQMARMAQQELAFVPTLVTREEDARADEPAFMQDPRLEFADPLSRWAYGDDAGSTLETYASAQDRTLLDRALQQAKADTLAAYRAGVPVFAGSDTIIAGPRLHDELALLADAGLSNAEVLRAATLDPARFMGREESLGSIEVGKRADLILLSAHPLADIRNAQKIAGVMLNGHYFGATKLTELKQFVIRQANHPANWARMVWGFLTSPVGSSL
ncbi:amidohydrolase family protein [Altererythrobacter sp. BO-6]|uniref:amidohydrolase family protein n=1 Tax=Altererythrobacter sp. BO-6 TaxID=2604537 RepID=UPI0013E1D5FE|nr:amidohydrolase family protein [Altererythrobacter sp. BO-6]QIG52989.1 amidohydrolase family protein [Altererythrobacter sp. BO-6]